MGELHTRFEDIAKCMKGQIAPYFDEEILDVILEKPVHNSEEDSIKKLNYLRYDVCYVTKNHRIFVEAVHKNPLNSKKIQRYKDANIDALFFIIRAKKTTDKYPDEYILDFLKNKHNYQIISQVTPLEIVLKDKNIVFTNFVDNGFFFEINDNENGNYILLKREKMTYFEKDIIKRHRKTKDVIYIPGYDSKRFIKENLEQCNEAVFC